MLPIAELFVPDLDEADAGMQRRLANFDGSCQLNIVGRRAALSRACTRSAKCRLALASKRAHPLG